MWSFLKSLFGHSDEGLAPSATATPLPSDGAVCINPATGLPMLSGDCSGVDVAGNPYGCDLDDAVAAASLDIGNDGWNDGSGWNDCFSATDSDLGSSWD